MECKVCQQEFDRIQWTHLKKHGLTLQQYKEMFPNAKTCSDKTRKKLSAGRWKGGKLKVQCDWCGVEFERYASQIQAMRDDCRDIHVYCSTKCMGKHRSILYKGRKLEEANKKLSEMRKEGKNPSSGRRWSEEQRRKFLEANSGENAWMYGRHHSEETRRKISEAHMGKSLSEEHRKKLSKVLKGRIFSDATIQKMSKAMKRYRKKHPMPRGNRHPHWKGGYPRYKGENWREQRAKALDRDSHKCRRCGVKPPDKEPNVHHIVRFREFGLKRYKEANRLSNLISLCDSCHGLAEAGIIPREDLRELIGLTSLSFFVPREEAVGLVA